MLSSTEFFIFFGVFTSFTLCDSKYTLVDVASVHPQDVVTATMVIMAKNV